MLERSPGNVPWPTSLLANGAMRQAPHAFFTVRVKLQSGQIDREHGQSEHGISKDDYPEAEWMLDAIDHSQPGERTPTFQAPKESSRNHQGKQKLHSMPLRFSSLRFLHRLVLHQIVGSRRP